MLDRVVDVVRRDVDRQADGVAPSSSTCASIAPFKQRPFPVGRARGQVVDAALDLVPDLADALDRHSGRILEPPVDVARPG